MQGRSAPTPPRATSRGERAKRKDASARTTSARLSAEASAPDRASAPAKQPQDQPAAAEHRPGTEQSNPTETRPDRRRHIAPAIGRRSRRPGPRQPAAAATARQPPAQHPASSQEASAPDRASAPASSSGRPSPPPPPAPPASRTAPGQRIKQPADQPLAAIIDRQAPARQRHCPKAERAERAHRPDTAQPV